MHDGTRQPDAVCEGGDLDCGSGLLLIIRSAMAPLTAGGLLEVRSREASVREDLPAWCRMVGHQLVADEPGEGRSRSYFIQKKGEAEEADLDTDLDTARDFRWGVRVSWTAGMQATAYARNHAIPVGQPASFDTEDAAPSAIELLLTSLGGCLAVGFQWRASRQGIDIEGLEVTLSAGADNILVFLGVEDTGHPGLAEVECTAYVRARADDETLASLWRETVARSPVLSSLTQPVEITATLKVT